MKLTALSKDILHHRRGVKKLLEDGFEEIGESGGNLWKFHRGCWLDHRITDVAIGPDGKSLYIKHAPTEW